MALNNIYPIQTQVSKQQREKLLKQHAKLIWFTGLSGSGKSTLAVRVEEILHSKGFKTYLLDGDNLRSGLNKDLSFTDNDRKENIRRIGELSKLMLDAGLVVLSTFISPFKEDRDQVMKIVGEENYIEVYVDTPLEICEERDVKGLYKKARAGELKNFTGVDSPYEKPESPDIIIRQMTVKDSVELLLDLIVPRITL